MVHEGAEVGMRFHDRRCLGGVYEGCGKLAGMVDAKLQCDVSAREEVDNGGTYRAI